MAAAGLVVVPMVEHQDLRVGQVLLNAPLLHGHPQLALLNSIRGYFFVQILCHLCVFDDQVFQPGRFLRKHFLQLTQIFVPIKLLVMSEVNEGRALVGIHRCDVVHESLFARLVLLVLEDRWKVLLNELLQELDSVQAGEAPEQALHCGRLHEVVEQLTPLEGHHEQEGTQKAVLVPQVLVSIPQVLENG